MTAGSFSEVRVSPDWERLLACIMRRGTPSRVHHIELFLDDEIQEAIWTRFDLGQGLSPDDPHFQEKRAISIQRFLGYDYVRQGVEGLKMPLKWIPGEDTAALPHEGGRTFIDEATGPITSWEEFETFAWPDPANISAKSLEWYEQNLPDDMCVVGSGGFGHFAEFLTWLMGYETLCFALYDNPRLVRAIADRLESLYTASLKLMLGFERVKLVWGSDDMGFRTSTLIGAGHLREFVLPGHRKMAAMAHAAGRPYLLHSCGNLGEIMDDLINDVKIDGRHSFEDTIERVEDAKRLYGDRVALLGGIDLDLLCRGSEEQIRRRVRETLDVCQPGGGYCLGSGNSVANYVPVDSFLAMLDEGRRYSG